MITTMLFISLAIYCLSEQSLLQGAAKTAANFCIYLWHVLPIQTLQRAAHSLEQYYLYATVFFYIIYLTDYRVGKQ